MDLNSLAFMKNLTKKTNNHFYFGAKYFINYGTLTRVRIKITANKL